MKKKNEMNQVDCPELELGGIQIENVNIKDLLSVLRVFGAATIKFDKAGSATIECKFEEE